VHALLEELDFASPRAPEPDRVAEVVSSFGDRARAGEAEEIVELVERFAASDLCARIAAADSVRTELDFAFDLGTGGGRSVLVTGIVDVYATTAGRTLVVDYKSDRLEGRSPAEAVESSYATQRTVYALAALHGGAEAAEVVYAFLERPDETASATYTAADLPALEQDLRDLSAGIVEGRFAPAERPWRGLCADCPGRRALCSWGSERTLAAEPAVPVAP
jgi:ATP-dependent helicase/nuclease subunit A